MQMHTLYATTSSYCCCRGRLGILGSGHRRYIKSFVGLNQSIFYSKKENRFARKKEQKIETATCMLHYPLHENRYSTQFDISWKRKLKLTSEKGKKLKLDLLPQKKIKLDLGKIVKKKEDFCLKLRLKVAMISPSLTHITIWNNSRG